MSNGPPVIFEYRCKICQMAKSHPDLYKELHYQVLEVGAPHTRAMNYINKQIESTSLPLQKLNNQNMNAHFSSHILVPDRVNSELQKLSPNAAAAMPLRDVSPEASHYVEDLVRRKVGNEVSDYLNIDHLRSQLMEKLDFIDDMVTKEIDGKKYVDLDLMSQYTTIIKEIRTCITDLNKIRQSKQLMQMLIKSLVEKTTFETVRKLSREYDQVKRDLLDAGVASDIVTRTDQQLRIRLAEIVSATARTAIEEVTRTYKLN